MIKGMIFSNMSTIHSITIWLFLSLFSSIYAAEQAIKTDNNVKQIALQKNKHLDIHTLYSKMKDGMENERYEHYSLEPRLPHYKLPMSCGPNYPLSYTTTQSSIIKVHKAKEEMEKTVLQRKNFIAKLFKLNPEISKERKEEIIGGFEKYKKSSINSYNCYRRDEYDRRLTKKEWRSFFWKQKSRAVSLVITRYLNQERERLKERGYKEDKTFPKYFLLRVTKDIYGVACMYCHNKKDGLNKSSVVDNHIAASHIDNVFDDIEPTVLELKPWGDIHSDEYRALIFAYENL